MKFIRAFLMFAVVLSMVVLPVATSQAQVNATPQTINVSFSQSETLSVSLSTNSFALTATNNTPSVTVTTNWNLAQSRVITVAAWFASANAALSNGTTNYPSSNVSMGTSAGAYPGNGGACSQTSANVNMTNASDPVGDVSGAICPLIYVNPTANGSSSASAVASFTFSNLSSLPASATPYTGSLFISAIAE